MASKMKTVKSPVKRVSPVRTKVKSVTQEPERVKQSKHRFVPSEKLIVPGLLALVLVAVIVTGYTTLTKNEKSNQNAPVDQRELSKLVDKVGDHILLPEGEQATIATVSDVTKLQDQEFFKNAQNGDKVLIYAQAKKAILYRPSDDKVIEIGPVFDNEQEQVAGATTEVTRPAQQPVVSPSPSQNPQQEGTSIVTPTVTNSATQ